MNAKLIQVIQTTHSIGQGTPEDPAREVTSYFSTDGQLLAVDDPKQGTVQGNQPVIGDLLYSAQKAGGSTAYEALKKIQSQITTCHL